MICHIYMRLRHEILVFIPHIHLHCSFCSKECSGYVSCMYSVLNYGKPGNRALGRTGAVYGSSLRGTRVVLTDIVHFILAIMGSKKQGLRHGSLGGQFADQSLTTTSENCFIHQIRPHRPERLPCLQTSCSYSCQRLDQQLSAMPPVLARERSH